MDGQEYFEWLVSQKNGTEMQVRARQVGYQLGYSARIWCWSPAQVERVKEQLEALPPAWGGSATSAK